MVVDLFDAKTKRLVWRGIATDTISSDPQKNAMKIEKAVEKMFKKFPPAMKVRSRASCELPRAFGTVGRDPSRLGACSMAGDRRG
jgi:hypothetical protein